MTPATDAHRVVQRNGKGRDEVVTARERVAHAQQNTSTTIYGGLHKNMNHLTETKRTGKFTCTGPLSRPILVT